MKGKKILAKKSELAELDKKAKTQKERSAGRI